MAPSGGGDEARESGGPPVLRGVRRSAAGAATGQNHEVESGSRKRKTAVKSEDSICLVGNGEHLKVVCEDSQRILKEIEDLRAQLDEDVKELGYCEANQKLRVELALKAKEMQCLRKQSEEIQGKNDGMRKQNEELQAKNDGMAKQNKELQAKNDGLVKENEELRTNIDSMRKRNGDLQAKNGGLTKWNEELQGKSDGLMKQNEELRTNVDIMRRRNVDLQAKNGGLMKQNVELQAKNYGMMKQNEELKAKNVDLTKQNEEVQTNNDCMRKRNGELQAKNGGLTKQNEELQAKNDSLTKWIEELEAKNDSLDRNAQGLEDESNGQTAIGIKRMGELDEKLFQNACKRKYGNVDYQTKAAELVESWQDELKKPSWHPFVAVQVNGEHQEVLDDDDAKLKLLRFEYGDDVCNAVKTALMEINKYSPSERYVVPQFWNFRKDRKATMKEVLKYLF